LDNENLVKTHEAFLDECKHLEEAKDYIKKGFSVPKTIHGKTLEEYLVINRKDLGMVFLDFLSDTVILLRM
jgi:hypothetical protein